MSRKYKCRYCGDMFSVDRETEELINEGYFEGPDSCEDCAGNIDHAEPDNYSDADPGL